MVDFIAIYRSEPCLWQVISSEYHDRAKKDAAYKLAKKLDELEPGATNKSVVTKINSLRSAFRKEQKKVEASKKSGASVDSIYKPLLWYCDLFDFLHDQHTPRASSSNLDSETEEIAMAGIRNADLFDLWRSQKNRCSPSSTEAVNLFFNYIRDKCLVQDEVLERNVLGKVKGFCTNLEKRWRNAKRTYSFFIRKNSGWLSNIFNVPTTLKATEIEKTSATQSSTSGLSRGRPQKEFSQSSEKTKRRRIKLLKENSSPQELVFAAKSVLRDEGKRAAADVVSYATEYSPERPVKIRKVYKESFKSTGIVPYTEDEGLALMVSTRMTKDSYHKIRLGAKIHNAQNLYPSYDKIIEAKKRCYPAGITVGEFGASIILQDLLNHTVTRIFQTITMDDELTFSEADFVLKYGCDGTSGQKEFMQTPRKESRKKGDDEENEFSDANLFLFSDSDSSDDEAITNNIYKMLKEMRKTIDYMAIKFDEMQKENKEIRRMLKESEKENTELKERVKALELNIEEEEKEKIKNKHRNKWNRQTREAGKEFTICVESPESNTHSLVLLFLFLICSAKKVRRPFLAKYWLYIVPVVIIMVVTRATNPEGGNPGSERGH
ncbi:hypothetical protein MML48_2g00000188 [Holotrichia oblita]|uniref:Uncharacterized protein n=1 Tax=Holotrichia oblita TaxID=644536 RepID=A0ACB9TIE8_HOLOL|nr:hypothetical protein MML48_2g00000188 [Holotrichia oblita]